MGSFYFCSNTESNFQPIQNDDISPCLWESISSSLSIYYLIILLPLISFYFHYLPTSSRPWTSRYVFTFYASILMIILTSLKFGLRFLFNKDVEIYEYYCGITNTLSWIIATILLYKRLEKGLQGANGIIITENERPILTLKTWATSHKPLTIFWLIHTLFLFSNLRYDIRSQYFPSSEPTEEEAEFTPFNFYSTIVLTCFSFIVLSVGISSWWQMTKINRGFIDEDGEEDDDGEDSEGESGSGSGSARIDSGGSSGGVGGGSGGGYAPKRKKQGGRSVDSGLPSMIFAETGRNSREISSTKRMISPQKISNGSGGGGSVSAVFTQNSGNYGTLVPPDKIFPSTTSTSIVPTRSTSIAIGTSLVSSASIIPSPSNENFSNNDSVNTPLLKEGN